MFGKSVGVGLPAIAVNQAPMMFQD